MKSLIQPPEVFDINAEIERRLKSCPDGIEALKQFIPIIRPTLLSACADATAKMPDDVDFQRVGAAQQKWVMLEYAFAHKIKHGSIKGVKLKHPKNGFPSAQLVIANMVIEQHGVRTPHAFVTESQGRRDNAKMNAKLSTPNMFTSVEDFMQMRMHVLLTYCLDTAGKLWVLMGVPNETYTDWVQIQLDLLKLLGMDGSQEQRISAPSPVPPTPIPTVKSKVKKEKERNDKWQKTPHILTAQS